MLEKVPAAFQPGPSTPGLRRGKVADVITQHGFAASGKGVGGSQRAAFPGAAVMAAGGQGRPAVQNRLQIFITKKPPLTTYPWGAGGRGGASLRLCLSVRLSLCLSISLCIFLPPSLSLCVSVPLCLCLLLRNSSCHFIANTTTYSLF